MQIKNFFDFSNGLMVLWIANNYLQGSEIDKYLYTWGIMLEYSSAAIFFI